MIRLGLTLLLSAFGPAQAPNNSKSIQLTGSIFLNSKVAPRIKIGDVTLVHFWTFACHNCKANFAAYDRLFQAYNPKGLNVVGVHTPELEFERKVSNVQKAIEKEGIKWPVLIDDKTENWKRWNLQYWPTVFILDKKGEVRFKWEGEFAWKGRDGEAQALRMIEKLLAEK